MSDMPILKLLKKLSKLRRLFPAGLIVALFFAPILFMMEDWPDLTSPGTERQPPVGTTGPRVDIDPFERPGVFGISQQDADRASWSWDRAKRLAADVWEEQLPGTGTLAGFYCGCNITRRGSTGGSIDLASCGYEPRGNATRAARLEWEHIVPASYIGRGRSCWTEGGTPMCRQVRNPL